MARKKKASKKALGKKKMKKARGGAMGDGSVRFLTPTISTKTTG